MMIGDIGVHLQTMETDLNIRLKTGTTNAKGYEIPDLSSSTTFKGVIIPMSSWTASQLGVHERGDSILYIRLSQENCPDLGIEDEVTDGNGNKWKITREMDYEQHGDVKLFTIQKVT